VTAPSRVSRFSFRVLLLAFAAASGACSSKPEPPKAATTYTLRKVSLPDLSHAAPAVQQQVRDGFAALTKQVNAASLPPGKLGTAYGQMGMLLLAAKYRDEAEPALLNAQTFSPRDARWPYYLAHLYKLKGDAAQSRAAFAHALELQPNDVPTLIWLGEADVDQGNYAHAVECLEKASTLDPQATAVHYPLAMAYRGLRDEARAQAHLARGGAPATTHDDPLMQRVDGMISSGLVYEVNGADALERGDWKSAADSFRKGIDIAPGQPSLHHKLGTALALLGDRKGAVEQFERAIAIDPTFAKAQYGLGLIQASSGRNQEAEQHFTAALAAEPGDVDARVQLAHLLRRAGRFDAALPHYAAIVKADAHVPEARFGFAAALVGLRRYADARNYLAEAVRVYPTELAFANALARVLAAAPEDNVRDGRRAVLFAQAVLAQIRTADTLETMAMAQAEVRQFTEAVRWQNEAIAAAEQNGERGTARRIADTLRLYESRKPCRTPWRPGVPLEFQSTNQGK
jgi:tetratricopeptide (TPR) repeat protein